MNNLLYEIVHNFAECNLKPFRILIKSYKLIYWADLNVYQVYIFFQEYLCREIYKLYVAFSKM